MILLTVLICLVVASVSGSPQIQHVSDDMVTITLDGYNETYMLERARGVYGPGVTHANATDAIGTFVTIKSVNEFIVYTKVNETSYRIAHRHGDVDGYYTETGPRDLQSTTNATTCAAQYAPPLVALDVAVSGANEIRELVYDETNITYVDEGLNVRRMLQDPYAHVPGCYDGDIVTNILDVTYTTDLAFYNLYGSTLSATAALEFITVFANTVYGLQFNVELRVVDMTIVSPGDPLLTQYPELFNGACPRSPQTVHSEFRPYIATHPTKVRSAHEHMFSGCDPSDRFIGVAYQSRACYFFNTATGIGNRNSGVSLAHPDVSAPAHFLFMHELAHNLGSSHSISGGGIMNSRSVGYIEGTNLVRFQAPRSTEMCNYMDTMKDDRCPFFNVKGDEPAQACGDGILSATESCECEDRTSSCSGCVNCILTNPTTECSTSTFFMHIDVDNPVFTTGKFSDATCCINGIAEPVSTTCGNKVCQKGGVCKHSCRSSVYCGQCASATNSGCRTMCRDARTEVCSPNWEYQGQRMGDLPEGTKCEMNGNLGFCDGNGECLSPTGIFMGDQKCVDQTQPTPPPTTQSPTNFPTTRSPTNFPTTSTPTVTNAPTTGTPATSSPTTGTPATSSPTTGTPATSSPTTGTSTVPIYDNIPVLAGVVGGGFVILGGGYWYFNYAAATTSAHVRVGSVDF